MVLPVRWLVNIPISTLFVGLCSKLKSSYMKRDNKFESPTNTTKYNNGDIQCWISLCTGPHCCRTLWSVNKIRKRATFIAFLHLQLFKLSFTSQKMLSLNEWWVSHRLFQTMFIVTYSHSFFHFSLFTTNRFFVFRLLIPHFSGLLLIANRVFKQNGRVSRLRSLLTHTPCLELRNCPQFPRPSWSVASSMWPPRCAWLSARQRLWR